MTKQKEIIIWRHNGGRLGNQLLLFASVYAYCLEKGYRCINYTFYNYRKYFDLPPENFRIKVLNFLGSFNLYHAHSSHLIVYYVYKVLTFALPFILKGIIIKEGPKIYNLPPSKPESDDNKKIIQQIENSQKQYIYLDGWHFRNPQGLEKFHQQVKSYLKPKDYIIKRVDNYFNTLKNKTIIGVHIRQGDYRRVIQGQLYFSPAEVYQILKYYLKKNKLDPKKTMFVICSDEAVQVEDFPGLNVKLGIGSLIEDMITLSRCQLIIGSDSTFGSFAAYLGQIPFITFNRDWIKT